MDNQERPQENLNGLIQSLYKFLLSGWGNYPIFFESNDGKIYSVSTIGMTACSGYPDDTPEEYKSPIGFVLKEADSK